MARQKPATLFIVCGDEAARFGLKAFFARYTASLRIVAVVEGARRALATCLSCLPTVMLLDVNVDGGGGWQLLEEVRKRSRHTACAARLPAPSWPNVMRAHRAGALAVCTTSDDLRYVAEAVLAAAGGKSYVSPSIEGLLRDYAVRPLRLGEIDEQACLGARERQVFSLLGEGLGTREIATVMGIERKSVQAHCDHIKDKLGLRSFQQLIHQASSMNGHRG